jgi:hypothetical protein
MKQPADHEQQQEDKREENRQNPAQGIDPEPSEPKMEADLNDQDPGERQKENQNKEKDDPLAA